MKYRMFFGLLLPFYTYSTTFMVTNTNDSGAGSLRDAMLNAQTDPTPPSLIYFNIAGGVPQTITPITPLPVIQTTTTIDGTTQQPGWVPGDDMPIVLDCQLLTVAAPTGYGLLLDSVSDCLIRGLAIKSYVGGLVNGNAIRIRTTTAVCDNNQINNCFFGCNADGSLTGPFFPDNTRSIVVRGSSAYAVTNTIIGGTNPGDGNLFVNTSVNAIALQFNVNNTLIQNNLFGTDRTGTTAVGGNPYDIAIFGYDGVNLDVACSGTIIRSNVLSNNTLNAAAAVNLVTNVHNTVIDDNKIGTDITGSVALSNQGAGINTFGSTDLTVTGTQITNNIISGNPQGGIILNDFTDNSVIQNNKIGTDVSGSVAIPNGIGIIIQADTGATGFPLVYAVSGVAGFPSTNNSIGGPLAGQGNLISGNTGAGIVLTNDAINTTIEGNIIGLNSTQTALLPNTIVGIQLVGAVDMPVMGTLIKNNVISGNTAEGINMGPNVINSTVQGNFIGTNSAGSAFGNGSSGVVIAGGLGLPATNNTIGGINPGEGNTIQFNGTTVTPSYGVIVGGNSASPDILNPILGNNLSLNDNNGIELVNNGNNLQDVPVIVTATGDSTLVITATAPTLPAASTFRLEFFVNEVNRNPITEGQLFIGAMDGVASGATVTQSFTVPGGIVARWVSATATNLNNVGDTYGDTSAYSLNASVFPTCSTIPGQNIWHKVDDLGKCLYRVIIAEGEATCNCVNDTLLSVSDEITTLLRSILDIVSA